MFSKQIDLDQCCSEPLNMRSLRLCAASNSVYNSDVPTRDIYGEFKTKICSASSPV